MKPIDSGDEQLYLDAVSDMRSRLGSGGHPTEILSKVAEQRRLRPEEVRLLAHVFNQASQADILEKAGSAEERTAVYPVADPEQVIRQMLQPAATVQKIACELPTRTRALQQLQKTAEREQRREPVTVRQALTRIQKLQSLQKEAESRLQSETGRYHLQLHDLLQKTAEHLRRMPDRQMIKTARTIVNGYRSTGQKLLNMLRKSAGLTVPEIERTAYAAVLPPEEPYLTVEQLHDTAERIAGCSKARQQLQKQAGAFAREYTANLLANVGAPSVSPGIPKKDGEKLVDPELRSELDALERRRIFFDLTLRDRDLQNYDFADLVNAYNDSILLASPAADNPAVLKQMMLQHLESGGIKDMHQLEQAVKTGKTLQQVEESRKKELREDTGSEDAGSKDAGKIIRESRRNRETSQGGKSKGGKQEKEASDISLADAMRQAAGLQGSA